MTSDREALEEVNDLYDAPLVRERSPGARRRAALVNQPLWGKFNPHSIRCRVEASRAKRKPPKPTLAEHA